MNNWNNFVNRLKSLSRLPVQGQLGGVCAGIAYSFETPLWLIQLVFVVATFCIPGFALFYILLWIFLPPKLVSDEEFARVTREPLNK